LSNNVGQLDRRSGVLPILGLIAGSHLMLSYLVVGLAAPVLPLLLAAVTALSARARPLAVGSLAAALGGVVFLVSYAAAQSL
jgi:hypothetical protein